MSPDHRGAALSASFITPPVTVDGRKLRPLSAASFELLKRTGNAFITANDDPDRKVAAAMEFIYIHGAPLEEVIAATALPTARQAARANEMDLQEFLETYDAGERREVINDVMLSRFRAAVLRYNAVIPLELTEDTTDAIVAETEAAGAAVVEPKPKATGEDEDTADPN